MKRRLLHLGREKEGSFVEARIKMNKAEEQEFSEGEQGKRLQT